MPISDVAFSSSPQVQTGDADEASDILSRVYLPLVLRPTGAEALDMHMRAEELSMLTAGYVHFGTEVFIGSDEMPVYCVEAPLSGVARNIWRDGRVERTTVGTAAVLTPGMPVNLNWSSDCREICVKVSETQMRTQLETMLGRSVDRRITFARKMNLNTRASYDWFGLVRTLAREAGRTNGLLTHRLAVDNLQRQLVEGLLLIQPHNYSEELAAEQRPAGEAAVKRAVDLMHAHPEISWDTAGLAHATGVTARALQKAFQRYGHPPPMTCLRRIRLERVHTELIDSDSGATTVTAVAGRWGFVHLGRFADQYRKQFGHSPSATLRGTVMNKAATPR
ncbi:MULTISPECIES: AraC family transcriptional regulator [Mycolicibacterium]|uniref:Transcriptional regulator EutR n=1 Tax=Mycolicibacterium chlorophenolicum TaxID=37916 RepID=A0A0J6VX96_9MYCO|nr:AraC family transcriptional regulator [Mycolicibacterium chlorophenolicum]KMO74759.1 transcriptional regulator EutR [Mycolicibacterium chlorophenolicum]